MNVLEKLYDSVRTHKDNDYCKIWDSINKDFTIEEWIKLLFGSARKFCIRNKFPTVDLWNHLDKEFDLTKFGIYNNTIDAKITFNDSDDVLVIGGDNTIICDELKVYNIILMHGAKVTIKSSNFAIVFIESDNTCQMETEIRGNAKIIK